MSGILVPKPMLGRQLPAGRVRGPIAYWLFNEGSGNIVSDLINGNTGTLQGDTSWVPGKFGSALNFDGTDDYVQLASAGVLGFTTKLTIIGWVYIIDDASVQIFFTKWYDGANRAYELQLDMTASKWLKFAYSTLGSNTIGVVSDSSILTANQWIQIAVTFSYPGNIVFYLNGVQVGSIATEGAIYNNNMAPRIGTSWGGSFDFTGLIDNISAYNRALPASEIAELYLRPFAMFDRMPIELWVGATSVGVPAVGQPMMRRWANIPHMSYLGRRSA